MSNRPCVLFTLLAAAGLFLLEPSRHAAAVPSASSAAAPATSDAPTTTAARQTAAAPAPSPTPRIEGTTGPAADGSAPIRVAILLENAAGAAPIKYGMDVVHCLKQEPGFSWEFLSPKELTTPGRLAEAFDVVVFPGGTGGGQRKALGIEGSRRVTEFVRGGGGVLGICAGGYLVKAGSTPATKAIEMINANLSDGDHWDRGVGPIQVRTVNGAAGDTTTSIFYCNGPVFERAPSRDDMPAYTSLATYITDLHSPKGAPGTMRGRDAIIAAPCGKGRVVAIGPHPEDPSSKLGHWVCNAVRWAARGDASREISCAVVLEGRPPAPAVAR